MRLLVGKYNLKEDKGSVLMEAIICLPVLLLLSLGVAQFAHIWYCRTIVHYAAYSAARATLTAAPGTEQQLAREAAEIICSPISFLGSGTDFDLPGIGVIGGSGDIRNNDVLTVTAGAVTNKPYRVYADIQMRVPLLFPLAGPIIGRTMNDVFFADDPSNAQIDGVSIVQDAGSIFSRIRIRERVYMSKPYHCTWSRN